MKTFNMKIFVYIDHLNKRNHFKYFLIVLIVYNLYYKLIIILS
jgi:hypothetical protein